LYRNLIIHNLDGATLNANAFMVETNANNVQIRNVIAFYYDADGIYTSGTNLTVSNSTFYYARTSPSSNSIHVSGGSTTAYNVLAAGQETDFYSSGTLTLYNCMSEDSSAGSYGGSGNLTNKTAANQFVSLSGTIDLHLKAGSDAIRTGYDLSGTFTDDIDGQTRSVYWDIGADEANMPTDVYYSVGTSTANLRTGTPTITITSGTATLTVAQTGNIGVGDVITYNTSSKAYIKSVISQTTFVVQTAAGAAPANVSGQAVNSINRAFNTLSGGLSGAAGASYLTSSNLVALNVQLTFVFYFDSSSLVPDAAQLSGWTWVTDSTRYIKLTSADASMVASRASQRHTGKSGTGAGMVYSSNWILDVDHMSYLRVEWLEFNMNSSGWNAGIRYREDGGEGSESLTVIGCIAYGGGLYGFYNTGGDNATYINCISHGNGYGFYTDSVSSGTSYYNCTAHGNTNNGFRTNGVHSRVKNCLSTGNTGDDYLADGTGTGFD